MTVSVVIFFSFLIHNNGIKYMHYIQKKVMHIFFNMTYSFWTFSMLHAAGGAIGSGIYGLPKMMI